MRVAFAMVLLVHGAIHLPGFLHGVGLREFPHLTGVRTAREGWLWLAVAICFAASALAWTLAWRSWPWLALVAVLGSQLLIVRAWGDARYGTFVNVLILVPVLVALAEFRAGSLRSTFAREAELLVRASRGADTMVTDADLARVPGPVQRFLRRAGVVGQPHVRNFRLTFDVSIRGAPNDPWTRGTAVQYESFDPPKRLFYMRATRAGVPFDGLHRYVGDSATMDIRLLGLYRVQFLEGADMTRSETVTLLNDICLLAPAVLLRAPITWDVIDAQHVRATFTNAGHRVSAVLVLDEAGDLVDFISEDRSRAAGNQMLQRRFATPVRKRGVMAGTQVVVDGDATWTDEGREWTYGRFLLTSLAYNVAAVR